MMVHDDRQPPALHGDPLRPHVVPATLGLTTRPLTVPPPSPPTTPFTPYSPHLLMLVREATAAPGAKAALGKFTLSEQLSDGLIRRLASPPPCAAEQGQPRRSGHVEGARELHCWEWQQGENQIARWVVGNESQV